MNLVSLEILKLCTIKICIANDHNFKIQIYQGNIAEGSESRRPVTLIGEYPHSSAQFYELGVIGDFEITHYKDLYSE